MSRQAEGTGRNWYVIHTYSGYEDAVKEGLMQRIESLGMQDLIFDVVVPKEQQIVIKKGEPVTVEKTIFPGYVLVDMIVTDDSWYIVRILLMLLDLLEVVLFQFLWSLRNTRL